MKDKPYDIEFHIKSRYDYVHISLFKYRNGKMKALRNYVNVILIRDKKTDMVEEDPTYQGITRIVKVFENQIRLGKIPTEIIPWNSSYYSELLVDIHFPRKTDAWIHKKGRDGEKVHFRLGQQGKSLMVLRNGVLVQLFPHF